MSELRQKFQKMLLLLGGVFIGTSNRIIGYSKMLPRNKCGASPSSLTNRRSCSFFWNFIGWMTMAHALLNLTKVWLSVADSYFIDIVNKRRGFGGSKISKAELLAISQPTRHRESIFFLSKKIDVAIPWTESRAFIKVPHF